MTTKELIESEIQTMDESQLSALYQAAKQIGKKKTVTPSIMSKLKSVKIQAPEDFSTNFDLYASGEKRAT